MKSLGIGLVSLAGVGSLGKANESKQEKKNYPVDTPPYYISKMFFVH